MKLVDITGQRFGMLTVIEKVYDRRRTPHTQWLCQCDCGITGEQLVGRAIETVYGEYKQWCEDSGERSPYARRTWTAKVKENVALKNGATLESRTARVDNSTRVVRVFAVCNV